MVKRVSEAGEKRERKRKEKRLGKEEERECLGV